ncbi:MAG: 50S ribosomal protein L9 [Ectothiorhodospiraceae bacterium]|nr:50S ribosomal protein L9 [Chromatiales bacterium]MCP5157086.1 50S ribosomal protein L9 [Ectothiorhodospiraceae bacterium]
MQVILLEKVTNLGRLGDTVKVKPGYARNFLIPKGKAASATAENLAAFEARRAELERQEAEQLDIAQGRASELDGLVVTIHRRAGDEGRLFGSVGTADVAEAINAAGVEVRRAEVRMADALRQTGEFPIAVHLHADIDAIVTVRVEAEG